MNRSLKKAKESKESKESKLRRILTAPVTFTINTIAENCEFVIDKKLDDLMKKWLVFGIF